MRRVSRAFFYGEVGTEDLVKWAYWLAHFYGVDPDVMLRKQPDEIVEHVMQTAKMRKKFKL